MADYKHGAYGQIQTASDKLSDATLSAIVYFGTAPVHTLEGGAENVNVPKLVNSMAEAKRLFGYSDDWASWTLCEAMHVHFELNGVGPLVLVNVFDPATMRGEDKQTLSKTPADGRIVIAAAESIILDTVVIKTTGESPVTKVKGVDYNIVYDQNRKQITITSIGDGLGTAALTIEYYEADATQVEDADVIGSDDGAGLHKGVFVLKDVYQKTGYIPAYAGAPGFSSHKSVHAALVQQSHKINKHWDCYLFVDIPLSDSGTAITLSTAATWKAANGYTEENESVYFPMVKGTDGKQYHISVLAAANFQTLLGQNDGIPFHTPSNTPAAIIENLWLGADAAGRVYDDETINEKLNKYGISSAAFVGGRWAIWGASSADYTQESGTPVNISETAHMMLYYISNDFQRRRVHDVDKPLSANDLKTIMSEEQARLDALIKIGALTYALAYISSEAAENSDVYSGDYTFSFDVTTTPLAKSLTAIVSWTADGYETYFA